MPTTFSPQTIALNMQEFFKKTMKLSAEQESVLYSEKLLPIFQNSNAAKFMIPGSGNVGVGAIFMKIIHDPVNQHIQDNLKIDHAVIADKGVAGFFGHLSGVSSIEALAEMGRINGDCESLHKTLISLPEALNQAAIVEQFISCLSIKEDVPAEYKATILDTIGYVLEVLQAQVASDIGGIYEYSRTPWFSGASMYEQMTQMSDNISGMITAPILQTIYLLYAPAVSVVSGLINNWLTQNLTSEAAEEVAVMPAHVSSVFAFPPKSDEAYIKWAATHNSGFKDIVSVAEDAGEQVGEVAGEVVEEAAVKSVLVSLCGDLLPFLAA